MTLTTSLTMGGFNTLNPFAPTIKSKYSSFHPNILLYSRCEHVWSYSGKIVILFRNFLNAAARSFIFQSKFGKELPEQMKKLADQTKLCSIISVPFSFFDCKSALGRTWNSFKLNDTEGVFLGSLSTSIIALSALDSTITFINTTLSTVSLKTIDALSATGMPLGFAITGMGTVSRTIQVAKANSLYNEIKPFLANKLNANRLQTFLENKIGISNHEMGLLNAISQDPKNPQLVEETEKIKKRKKAALLRSAPKDAVAELEKLFTMLNLYKSKPITDQIIQDASKKLQQIQGLLQKKFRIDIMAILANLIVFYALVLFKRGVQGAEPFLLVAISFIIGIGSLVYQDFYNT